MKQATLKMSAVYSLINDYVDSLQGAGLHFISEHMYKSDEDMLRRIDEHGIVKTSVFSTKYTVDDILNMIADAVLDDENFVKYVQADINACYSITKTIAGIGRVISKGQTRSVSSDTLIVIIGKQFDDMGNIEKLYTRSVYCA